LDGLSVYVHPTVGCVPTNGFFSRSVRHIGSIDLRTKIALLLTNRAPPTHDFIGVVAYKSTPSGFFLGHLT
jgi:hypothetical protein